MPPRIVRKRETRLMDGVVFIHVIARTVCDQAKHKALNDIDPMSTRTASYESAVTINVHERNTTKPATKASVKCIRIHPPANTSFGLIQIFLHRNNSKKRNKNKNESVLPYINSGQHRIVIVKSLLPYR